MAPAEYPIGAVEIVIAGAETDVDEAVVYAYEDAKGVISKAYDRGRNYAIRDLKRAGIIIDIPPDPNDLDFLDEYNLDLIKGLGEDIKKDIKRVIRDGIINGKSVEDIARDLRDVLRRKDWRINTIARTETMRASNYGRIRTYEKSGVVKYKEWLTAFDDRTCPTCADLDGERVPLADNFSIGVYAPPAHPNCRCTIVPIIDKPQLAAPDPVTLADDDDRDKIRKANELWSKTLESEYSKALRKHFRNAIRKTIERMAIEFGGG